MDWNQLQRFWVIAQEENLSRAAEKLETSQPSLSQIIKRLENELGYPLFERSGKRIHLNESGKIFLHAVIHMDEIMQNTRLKLEEMNGIKHPEVTIYVAAASTLLPEMLLYLKKRNPHIQYRIHQWKSVNDKSDIDIQILAGPIGQFPTYDIKGEHNEILLLEETYLALPKGHSLLNKSILSLNDLNEEEFISLNENWQLGRALKKEMDRLSFNPNITMLVDNPNMMRELLKAHIGIAFVPAISWQSFAGDDIILRPVADFTISRLLYLRTKPRKYLTTEQKECIIGIHEFFQFKNQQYSG